MKPTQQPARPTTARLKSWLFQLEDRLTPATLFVDPTFPNTPGATATWTGVIDGQTTTQNVTIGQTGFRTIFEALAAANAPANPGLDTIRLSAGTFGLSTPNGGTLANGSLFIENNPVTLIGAGVGFSKVVPVGSTASGVTGLLTISGAQGEFNVRDLTLDGTGFNIGSALLYQDGAKGAVGVADPLNNPIASTPVVAIQNIAFPATADGYGVSGSDAGLVTVGSASFSGIGRSAVFIDNTTAQVVGNKFTGSGGTTPVNYGVDFASGADIKITGNTFTNFLSPANATFASAAISGASTDATLPPAKVEVFSNTVTTTVPPGSTALAGNGINVGTGTAADASIVTSTTNNYIGVDTALSATNQVAGATVFSTTDFIQQVTTPGDGAVVFTAPAAAQLPTTSTDGKPFTSPGQAQASASPTLFQFALSAGKGGSGQVQTFDVAGKPQLAAPITPLGNATNGVRVAYADVDGDGVADLITGTGPGVTNRVVITSGKTAVTIADFAPFETSFTGGVFVTAQDMNKDGKAEIVVTGDQGAGARVQVYNGASVKAGSAPARLADFFGLADVFTGAADTKFFGGSRAAIGDVNGDGTPDLLVAAGFLGGPRVTVWDGATVLSKGPGVQPGNPMANFFAFEQSVRDGVFISTGQFDATKNYDDIVLAGGPGGGPRVRIADGAGVVAARSFSLDTAANAKLTVGNFFAGDPNSRGGVRVLGRDLNGDGLDDLITATGDNQPAGSNIYDGKTVLVDQGVTGKAPTPLANPSFVPGVTLAGGVYVG